MIILSNVAWSISKADTAMQCMFKYNQVYNKKIKLYGHALTLGVRMHDIAADAIEKGVEDPVVIQKKLDATPMASDSSCGPEIYAMVPHVAGFVTKWKKVEEDHLVKPTIEQKYAIDRNLKPVSFMSKNVYFRGVIDLWAHSTHSNKLIVIDHKTNKSVSSANKVRESHQLGMYVWMLTQIHGFDWERAHIALNFLRHGKLVWAGMSMEEARQRAENYMALLTELELKIGECQENNSWPAEKNYLCNWCQFKEGCPAHQ